eukprot:jgi/Hompol1/4784/HPOL_003930-RA
MLPTPKVMTKGKKKGKSIVATIELQSSARPQSTASQLEAFHEDAAMDGTTPDASGATAASKLPLASSRNINVDIHRDDARDQVLIAVVKALIKIGNRPSTPKELASFILENKLTTLGYVAILR